MFRLLRLSVTSNFLSHPFFQLYKT
jgi:hypothetical protein